jgi:DNA-binding NarL/FixJ family response regulator
VLRAMLALDPTTRVVMLTSAQGDASVYEAIHAGACGYLLKGIEGGALGGATSPSRRRRQSAAG